ncbi:MAG: hypothetical protein JJE04_26535 [Acidobacteriia bacterium]|nr:hypothetical protein [Terriglobia bacterium]
MFRTKLAFVSSRPGLSETGGEWNLIHSRNIALVRLGCQVLMLCGLPEGTRVGGHLAGAEYPIRVITCNRHRWPAALVWDCLPVLDEFRPDVVVLSGAECTPGLLREVVKRYHTVLDIHGSLIEPWDYGGFRGRLFSFPRQLLRARRWHSRAAAALVVTEGLAEEYKRIASVHETFVVPCACLCRPTWDCVLQARSKWRDVLGIGCNELLLVHSGGLGLYQHPTPMLALLRSLLQDGVPARLLLATRKVDLASTLLAGQAKSVRDRVIVQNFETDSYPAVLAAGDVGLLLRDDNATNRAAFPNKTDEFWSAGVPVLTTDGLKAVARLVKRYPASGHVLDTSTGNVSKEGMKWFLELLGSSESARETRFNAILRVRQQISFLNTLEPFMDYLDTLS